MYKSACTYFFSINKLQFTIEEKIKNKEKQNHNNTIIFIFQTVN